MSLTMPPFRKGSLISTPSRDCFFLAIGEPVAGIMGDYYIRGRCLTTGRVYDLPDYYTTLTY